MKLRFTIPYRAVFGQSMHLCLRFESLAGRITGRDVPMRTDDGYLWTADVQGVVTAHSSVTRLVYHYQLEDDRGKVCRREWTAVPRVYQLLDSRNYLFQDSWRDLSIAHYLPHAPRPEATAIDAIPQFDRSVIFRVSAPQLRAGCMVALVGSTPALGMWHPDRYLPLTHIGDGDWMLSVNALAVETPFEYKYVVVDPDRGGKPQWEGGPNRTSGRVRMDEGLQLVVYGGNVRVPCHLRLDDALLGRTQIIDHEVPELYI